MNLTYNEYNTELKSIANGLIEEAIESLLQDDETIECESVREYIYQIMV